MVLEGPADKVVGDIELDGLDSIELGECVALEVVEDGSWADVLPTGRDIVVGGFVVSPVVKAIVEGAVVKPDVEAKSVVFSVEV